MCELLRTENGLCALCKKRGERWLFMTLVDPINKYDQFRHRNCSIGDTILIAICSDCVPRARKEKEISQQLITAVRADRNSQPARGKQIIILSEYRKKRETT